MHGVTGSLEFILSIIGPCTGHGVTGSLEFILPLLVLAWGHGVTGIYTPHYWSLHGVMGSLEFILPIRGPCTGSLEFILPIIGPCMGLWSLLLVNRQTLLELRSKSRSGALLVTPLTFLGFEPKISLPCTNDVS